MNKTYDNLQFSELIKHEEYDECTFLNCDFSDADLRELKFNDCIFESCNLSMSTLLDTAFRGVHFKDCKMLGLYFLNCNPFGLDMRFENCILNYSSFHLVNLRDTIFIATKLIDVDFAQANISGSVFEDCDLQGALFDKTNCEKVDFRQACNFILDPGNNRIAKAKFSIFGLPGLLAAYDIEIGE